MADRLGFIDKHPKIWEEVLEHDLRTGFGHFVIYSSVRNINMPSTTVSAPQVVRYILGFIENVALIGFDLDGLC
jgi:hypothetical protein